MYVNCTKTAEQTTSVKNYNYLRTHLCTLKQGISFTFNLNSNTETCNVL